MPTRSDDARARRRKKTRRLLLAEDDARQIITEAELSTQKLVASQCGIAVRKVYLGGATIQSRDIAAMTEVERDTLLVRDFFYDLDPRNPLRRQIEIRQAAGVVR